MPAKSLIAIEVVTTRILPRRRIEGISAVLLPFRKNGRPDYDAFAKLLARTVAAGLIPAVNMDTGYVNLLTPAQRAEVLRITRESLKTLKEPTQNQSPLSRHLSPFPFVAGAFVEGGKGELIARYRREIDAIESAGGVAILFQSTDLTHGSGRDIVKRYRAIARGSKRLLAFELGKSFAPFGKIYDLDTFRAIMETEEIIGAKHSSLDRELELQRLALRDRVRPGFKIYTGNDLAIDMVMYGSDYLLGLSTFSPEAFALRDRYWADGDARFYALNDLLQYLGFFAFRPPVPAYKHSAAQFLKIMGHIPSDTPPRGAQRRPDSDRAVLADIAERLESFGVHAVG